MKNLITVFLLLLLEVPLLLSGECTCDSNTDEYKKKNDATKYKVGAICSILTASAIGVSFPILGKKIKVLRPENNIFLMVKAFAAGVILATGFIHVLPDAFESLSSPCLGEKPWGYFPLTGFTSMVSAIVTMMVDVLANSYFKRSHFNNSKAQPVNGDEEMQGHTHTHGHALGVGDLAESSSELLRHRVLSQVLELGIVVHSIVIGVSLGASQSSKTIKPLVAALTFHQFFEGLGLGGCISQAQFKSRANVIMVLFFSLTTPVAIAFGMGISTIYHENSSTALIVEGVFNSASAGILIYMALVDLLAADFMAPRMQSNITLMLGANISLLLGSACMSLLAKRA